MSSPPVPYDRYFDFTTYAQNNPEKPLPGASVDVELNRLKTTTDQLISRLNEIQRDDGQLRNGIVTQDSLAPDVVIGSDGTAAAASAAEAAASAAAALISENNASASASQSFNSAHNSNLSATASANSAAAAHVSEVNAAASAASISGNTAAAAASAAAAHTSELNAAASATGAANSATAADASKTAAAGSATTATTQAGNASNSATAANASKVAAGVSETNAAASAAAAAASAGSVTHYDQSLNKADAVKFSQLEVQNAGSSANEVLIQHDGVNGYFRTQAGPLNLGAGGNNVVQITANGAALWPLTNNLTDLGAPANRYKTVYGVAGDFTSLTVGGSPVATLKPNKIINGSFRFNQRFGMGNFYGWPSTMYFADRWLVALSIAKVFGATVANPATSLPGMPGTFFQMTVQTAQAVLAASDVVGVLQYVEGTNCQDLMWGYNNGQGATATLSFWAIASVAGTYGGCIRNGGSTTRSFVFSYVLAANTWTKVVVAIPPETSATWPVDTTQGLSVLFVVAVGSSLLTAPNVWTVGNFYAPPAQVNLLATVNATWGITGVKLEVGSVATPFVLDDFETEYVKCLRYYQEIGLFNVTQHGGCESAANVYAGLRYLQPMRAAPTVTLPAPGTGTGQMYFSLPSGAAPATIGSHVANLKNSQALRIDGTGYAGLTAGNMSELSGGGAAGSAAIKLDAEL